MKRSLLPLLPGLLLSLSGGLFGQDDHRPGLESITEAELRDHIYFLASDYLNGRSGPSREYEIAAQYAASQFDSAGLQAVDSDMDCMDGYFQKVPFQKVVLDEGIHWILSTKEGEQEFLHNEDYKVLMGGFMPEEPLEVVFVGYGIQEPELGWDDLEGLDVEGKLVIMMSGAPMKEGEPVFPDSIHQKYMGMSGLLSRGMSLFKQRPAALVLALDSVMKTQMPFQMMPSGLNKEHFQYQGHSVEGDGRLFPMIYFVKDEVIQAIFEGQKTSPARIEEKGVKKYRTFLLEDMQIETRFPVLERNEVSLKNVVAVVPGTDPELSSEYITVGAHLDHVTLPSGEVANGADDNASGSAGVLEIAEAVAMNPPRRSVAFITYTAEEMGLNGSDFFVNAGPLALENIKFNVNLDMIGRTKKENMETHAHYILGPAEFEDGLVPFISEINNKSVNWPLIYDFHHPYAGSSDHSKYADHGIPCFFFFSGDHEDLHGPGDNAEKIEYDKTAAISRLAYLITMELANMDEVPSFTE